MTAFPDLFTGTLITRLKAELMSPQQTVSAVEHVFSRPLRPDDPNLSVGVYEGDARPVEYEIGQAGIPSLLEWDVAVQVYVKAAEEEDGRATRSLLLQRVRAALFSQQTRAALNVLTDSSTGERVMKYRLRRIAFASGSLHGGSKFFIGQAELFFHTENPEM